MTELKSGEYNIQVFCDNESADNVAKHRIPTTSDF